MVAVALAFQLVNSELLAGANSLLPWLAFIAVLAIAVGVIVADVRIREKQLDLISAVYFGLVIGLFLTYILSLALTPWFPEDPTGLKSYPAKWIQQWLQLLIGTVSCYTCISVLMQTRNDFRFIIPYVEFAKEIKGLKPCVLDTSVVIDGRIADLVETNVIDNQLIMPQFVIGELQTIADSSDRMRRNRGRRGLDVLNRLRSDATVDITIFERELPEFAGQTVDLKLVLLAKHLDGKVVTNDYNLNKVAKLHQVGVINVNDIANALKPVFLPGEQLQVRLIKPGEESGQGVGYLEDGTMVVIEGGREHINKTVEAAVTSVLQTAAGRMVFGKFERTIPDP